MQVESALGPALQAAYTIMQDYGGKMLVFQNAVPSLGKIVLLDAAKNSSSETQVQRMLTECSRWCETFLPVVIRLSAAVYNICTGLP